MTLTFYSACQFIVTTHVMKTDKIKIISSTNFNTQFNNTCMSHYSPRHVSGLDMPILRRNNCTNTASGILAVISGCTLHRLTADCSPLSTGVVYSRLEERGYQMLCLCSCSSWGWTCQGPKYVEDSNVTYMLLLNCALKVVDEVILVYIFLEHPVSFDISRDLHV